MRKKRLRETGNGGWVKEWQDSRREGRRGDGRGVLILEDGIM